MPDATWPILDGLPADDQRALLDRCAPRMLAQGERLFAQGDEANSMYLVVAGQLAVRVPAAGHDDGAIVAVLIEGEAVGEGALAVGGAVRGATVEALSAAELLEIGRADLDALRADGIDVDRILIRLLLNRSESLTQQLVESRVVATDVRIARRVLDLVDTCGIGEGQRLPLTTENLVALIGADYGTVKLCLGDLVRKHAVRLRGDDIHLNQLDALRAAADH